MVERVSLGFKQPDRSGIRDRVLASVKKGLSEADLAEQKASFVYGNAPASSGITKESARHAANYMRLK